MSLKTLLVTNYMYVLSLILCFVTVLTILSFIDGTFTHRIFFEGYFILSTEVLI